MLNSRVTDRNGASADLSYNFVGIPVSAFIGEQFGNGLRIEGEVFSKYAATSELRYAGQANKINSTVWCIGALASLYYEFLQDVQVVANGPYSPYVGMGVGLTNVNMSAGSTNGINLWNSDNRTAIAYQAAIGTGYSIRKNIILDLSYRYFGTTDVTIDQIKTDFSNHNIIFGVRYFYN